MKKTVIVVGSLNVDLTVRTPQFPLAGQTVTGSSLCIGVGGKGSNQATAAHRCGGRVCMIGRMGQDAMAQVVRDHYAREGLSRAHITESADTCTGVALIEVEDAGQNRIVIVPGANAELDAAQVEAAADAFADCGAVLAQLETDLAPVLAAKRLATKAGAPFLLNPAPYRPLPPDLLRGTDWLTPNETEAAALTELPVQDPAQAAVAARALLALGVKNVLVTLGAQGVYALWQGGETHLPPLPVQAVDTTGAGDAFNGAFAVALAEGQPVERALRFANCCAALSVTRPGAATAMPTRPEVERLLAETYGG